MAENNAIKVTKDMREAGAEVISRWADVYPPDDLAELVFVAMMRLANPAEASPNAQRTQGIPGMEG